MTGFDRSFPQLAENHASAALLHALSLLVDAGNIEALGLHDAISLIAYDGDENLEPDDGLEDDDPAEVDDHGEDDDCGEDDDEPEGDGSAECPPDPGIDLEQKDAVRLSEYLKERVIKTKEWRPEPSPRAYPIVKFRGKAIRLHGSAYYDAWEIRRAAGGED